MNRIIKQTMRLTTIALISVQAFVVSVATAADTKEVPVTDKRSKQSERLRAPNAMQCSADGATGLPLVAKDPKRDTSCFADWPKVAETVRSGSGMIIDTRSAEAYAQVHLPGAIRIPAELIKSKSYLARSAVLVYGDGKSDPYQEELCAQLKGAGFRNVRILSGGVLNWARTNDAKSNSEMVDIRGLAELSAAELYAEIVARDNLIVGFSSQFSNRQIDERRLKLEAPLSPERLAAVVQKAVKQAKAPIRRIVLVGMDSVDPQLLLQVLSLTRIEMPIFYYAGNLQSYEAAYARLSSQWAKYQKGPVAKKCGLS